MNEEIAKQVLAWLRETGSFIQVQAPALSREILIYGTITYSTAFSIGIGILLMAHKSYKYLWTEDCDDKDLVFPIALLTFLSSTLGLFIIYWNLTGILSIIYAPRLYVLSQISSFIK